MWLEVLGLTEEKTGEGKQIVTHGEQVRVPRHDAGTLKGRPRAALGLT